MNFTGFQKIRPLTHELIGTIFLTLFYDDQIIKAFFVKIF